MTAANLLERVDFHTHLEAPTAGQPGGRKAFLIELVHVVVQRCSTRPRRVGIRSRRRSVTGFETREAMAWSSRPVIKTALTDAGAGTARSRRWRATSSTKASSSTLAKNGRGLHRTFDHDVVLHADGSARITTKVTIANTLPAEQSAGTSTSTR